MDTNITIFTPLSRGDFDVLYPTLSSELKNTYFDKWIKDFYHRAGLFYRFSALKIQGYAEYIFRSKYNIIEGDPYPYPEWDDYAKSSQLVKSVNELNEIWNEYSRKAGEGKSDLVSFYEISKEVQDEFLYDDQFYIEIKNIWEFWFNKLINNPEDEVSFLLELKYSEYLYTQHWQTVRDAMLLIYRARCQATDCLNSGESWYGDEYGIHVHHMTYQNKGNERFKDLTLLCYIHHELWHENEKAGIGQSVYIENIL